MLNNALLPIFGLCNVLFYSFQTCNQTACDCDGLKGAPGSVGPPGGPGAEG